MVDGLEFVIGFVTVLFFVFSLCYFCFIVLFLYVSTSSYTWSRNLCGCMYFNYTLFYFIDTWQNPVFLKFTLYLKTYADTGEIIVTLNDDTIDSLCIELSLLICNMNYDTVILILILIAMPIIFKVTSYSAFK